MITPGTEEGGQREDLDADRAKDDLRNALKRVIESEERLKFFRKMVGWELGVREIEHFGEDLNKSLEVLR